jgi:hypothetical protein
MDGTSSATQPGDTDTTALAEAVADAELAVSEDQACESLIGFLMAERLDECLRESNWTLAEQIGILVEIARASPKLSERMAASDRLDRKIIQALKLAGRVTDETTRGILIEHDGDRERRLVLSQHTMRRAANALDSVRAALQLPYSQEPEPEPPSEDKHAGNQSS